MKTIDNRINPPYVTGALKHSNAYEYDLGIQNIWYLT